MTSEFYTPQETEAQKIGRRFREIFANPVLDFFGGILKIAEETIQPKRDNR